MPRYEFDCQNCGSNFTVAISIVDRDKVKCPDCGGKSLKQKFTPIAIGSKTSGGDSCNGCSGGNFG